MPRGGAIKKETPAKITTPSVDPVGTPAPSAATTTEPPATHNSNAGASGGTAAPVPTSKEFKITAKQWSFEPATITVNKNDNVKLLITSTDVAHGFFIWEYGINKTLTPGTTTVVEFEADQEGTFSFTCSVFCGSGHGGMQGTLIVK